MSQYPKDFDRYKFLIEPIIKPKKLTFDEWWASRYPAWKREYFAVDKEAAKALWQQAQYNK